MASDKAAAPSYVELTKRARESADRVWQIWLFVSGFALGVIVMAVIFGG